MTKVPSGLPHDENNAMSHVAITDSRAHACALCAGARLLQDAAELRSDADLTVIL
jgi:hypothetical protein